MIRRTLRLGMWLGLLVGLGFLVAKLLRTRSSPATMDLGPPGGSLGSTSEAWPPLQTPAATPAPVQIPEPAVETIATDEPIQTPTEARRTTLSRPPAAESKKQLPPWVAPENGICPKTHPVKAKLSSGIFQVEGNAMYPRTNPDRCYQTAESAAADGLRPAKR